MSRFNDRTLNDTTNDQGELVCSISDRYLSITDLKTWFKHRTSDFVEKRRLSCVGPELRSPGRESMNPKRPLSPIKSMNSPVKVTLTPVVTKADNFYLTANVTEAFSPGRRPPKRRTDSENRGPASTSTPTRNISFASDPQQKNELFRLSPIKRKSKKILIIIENANLFQNDIVQNLLQLLRYMFFGAVFIICFNCGDNVVSKRFSDCI